MHCRNCILIHFIILQLTCNSSNTHQKYKEIYWFICAAQLIKLDQPKAQHDTIIAYLDHRTIEGEGLSEVRFVPAAAVLVTWPSPFWYSLLVFDFFELVCYLMGMFQILKCRKFMGMPVFVSIGCTKRPKKDSRKTFYMYFKILYVERRKNTPSCSCYQARLLICISSPMYWIFCRRIGTVALQGLFPNVNKQ